MLESLLKAGFRFVTFERYARYLGVERDGFVALLEKAGGKVQLFGQVGYHVREGRRQYTVGSMQKGRRAVHICKSKAAFGSSVFYAAGISVPSAA
jgi:hypothetical protein